MAEPNNPQNVRPARKVSDIQGEVRVDQYLTNFSLAWRQEADQFVSPKAATPVPVRNQSDKYSIFPRGYFWRDEAEIRPLGGRPVQVGYRVENAQYLAEEWALEHTIDDRQRANADTPYDVDEAGVTLLEGKMMIREDRIWADSFFKPGIWAYDYEGNVDFPEFNDIARDPVATVNKFRRVVSKGSGFRVNTIVLGANVIDALDIHPALMERVKYTQTGILTNELLARMFKVQNVIVAESMYNAANEGADDDFEYIIDENAFWMGYIEPAARMNAPTAIARFAWTGLIPGAMNNLGGVINRGRDDRAYSDWIHSRSAFDMKQVAPDLGVFFENAFIPEA
jgi:hypothetical protein